VRGAGASSLASGRDTYSNIRSKEVEVTHVIKRFLSIGMAVVVGAFVAGSPIAHAQEVTVGPSDTIAFTGSAVILTDNTNNCGDPVDLLGPETPHVDLVAGCGTFNFSSTVCAGVSVGELPGLCTITANGSFNNMVCGTGTATGAGNVTGIDNGPVAFNITFVATIGVVTGTFSDPAEAGTENPDILDGVVQLGPGGTGPLPDGPPDCTNGFQVTGVIVGTEG
jgi:hypothetical protein